VWTPLHWAAGSGTPANVALLLKAGADVDARDEDGWTPLFQALFFSTLKDHAAANIPILLKAGADVNARTEDGYTPLLVAAWRGTSADIIVLLDAGADSRAKDKYGRTRVNGAGISGH
jgi:ankyrin repeat protein